MDKDGELVKYMFNVPSYLERGVNLQERAFSIGVLDWGNLEKWELHKTNACQIPKADCVSRSEYSSSFSANGLPTSRAVHGKKNGLQCFATVSESLHSVESHQCEIKGRGEGLGDHRKSMVNASRKNYVVSKHASLLSTEGAGLDCYKRDEIKLQGNRNNNRTQIGQASNHHVFEKESTTGPYKINYSPTGIHNDLSQEGGCSNGTYQTVSKGACQRISLKKSRDDFISDISHKKVQAKQGSFYKSGQWMCRSSKTKEADAPTPLFREASTWKDASRCQSSPHTRLFESILRSSNSPRLWSQGLKCCRSIDVSHPKLGKSVNSMVRALLRVASKNGRPLFSFALNTEREVLAATIKRKGTSSKISSKWSYTVFKVPSQKGERTSDMKGHQAEALSRYPIVVSHLNVSEYSYNSSTRQREFVLCPMEPRNDELATIVVQIPSKANCKTPVKGCQCQPMKEVSEGRSHATSLCSEDVDKCMCTTVILPSGVHSLPSKGVPTSLIERWKTGGSCDCGGWDVDCKLRILVDQNRLCGLSESKACPSGTIGKLAVFTEVHEQEQEHQPLLSLFPSKDGIYSVEFDSSISELQAFSICIAVLDCRSTSQCWRRGKSIDAMSRN